MTKKQIEKNVTNNFIDENGQIMVEIMNGNFMKLFNDEAEVIIKEREEMIYEYLRLMTVLNAGKRLELRSELSKLLKKYRNI
jgi:hypothetical protein